MKGIVLCGGDATRLGLLTRVTNKHLLPVGGKPMCLHPIEVLVQSGITEICVVIGGRNTGKFTEFLGDGSEFGASIYYRYQGKPLGISHAIAQCEDFVDGKKFAVILGDNIFKGGRIVDSSEWYHGGAVVILKQTSTPERFGVAKIESGKITQLVEKPKEFVSNYAVTGLYFFSPVFFNYFRNTKPSARGEYEIVDILNQYREADTLSYLIYGGRWTDAGTPESLRAANDMFRGDEK